MVKAEANNGTCMFCLESRFTISDGECWHGNNVGFFAGRAGRTGMTGRAGRTAGGPGHFDCDLLSLALL